MVARTSSPGESWYDALTVSEAREVHALELILDTLKAAMEVASERRGDIQKRAYNRVSGRLKSEERKLNWRKSDGNQE